MMGYAKSIYKSIQRRGILGTLRQLFFEFYFDRRFKTDTSNIILLDKLSINSKNIEHGVSYQGVNVSILKQCLKKINIDFGKSSFIDFGCGKGRALIYAGTFRFKKVIGVEFAKELQETAVENINIIKDKFPQTSFEALLLDATEYEVDPDINIFLFNNPFNELIASKVFNNIKLSIEKYPRRIYILYLNFSFADYNFIRDLGFTLVNRIDSKSKNEALIFSNEVTG